MTTPAASTPSLPRWERPSVWAFLVTALVVAFVVWSFGSVGLSWERIDRGIPALG